MILRQLSPAKPGCVSDLHSIFEALKADHCALDPLRSLIGDSSRLQSVSRVGGIAGKLAINVGDQGVLTLRRSVAPAISAGLRMVPVLGQRANSMLSGNTDLPGGIIEPDYDKNTVAGIFREAEEEGATGLPQFDRKTLLVGCYAQGTPSGVEAVVRVGIATSMQDLPKVRPSHEHTGSAIMLPSDPRFPTQWGRLGEEAMQITA